MTENTHTHDPYRGAGAPRRSNKPCDSRCMYAQPGSPCTCSCAGANHSRGWIESSGQEGLFDMLTEQEV
jgi:hypothetical protein